MQILTHRTNLLLSANDYQVLSDLSKKKKKTIAALIRDAVRKVYKVKEQDHTAKILRELRQLGNQAKTKNIDYKKLVNSGRKY